MKKYLCPIVIAATVLAGGCSRSGGRTDQEIATDVQNKINADTSFPDKGLTINANKGVVTLTGNVSSDAARSAAASDAAQVEGVKTVVNNLTLAPPQSTTTNEPQPEAQPQPQAQASNPQPTRSRSKPSAASWHKFGGSDTGATTSTANNRGSAASAPPPDTAASAAPAPAPVAPPPPQPVTIPSGTQLTIRLINELNSETAQVGDTFRASVSTPVMVGDTTVIPTSADVEGRVVDVKSAGRFAGQSDLVIELTRLHMNGKTYGLTTDRWSKAGSSRGKSTAEKVGGGAVVGAILGGIFGGGKGAAIGGAAGAGAGTGVSAAGKGQQIILKPEAELSFRLQNSISVIPGTKPQSLSAGSSNN
ncbi:MAG TPA: BON domain-containing protein [Candidatus Angelobacter sp.]|nr:BON domain-containing protein [Candidatus Angelobacter sp.]